MIYATVLIEIGIPLGAAISIPELNAIKSYS